MRKSARINVNAPWGVFLLRRGHGQALSRISITGCYNQLIELVPTIRNRHRAALPSDLSPSGFWLRPRSSARLQSGLATTVKDSEGSTLRFEFIQFTSCRVVVTGPAHRSRDADRVIHPQPGHPCSCQIPSPSHSAGCRGGALSSKRFITA